MPYLNDLVRLARVGASKCFLSSPEIRMFLVLQFLGDEVLDSFNNASRDDDNILDQLCIKQICSEFYYDEF